jgi:predicted MPP superfamily phosphohydrolase
MRTVNRGGAKAALPKVKTVEWLHLSDFHFHSTASQPRDRVLKSLCADLEESISNGWKPDFVAVTGDLAYSGDRDQLSRAWDYLRRILAICNLPKQQLFVVPGNHDVIDRRISPPCCVHCGRPDPQRSMPKYQQSLGC